MAYGKDSASKNITSKRILVIRRDENDRGGAMEIRVIEWGVDKKRYRNLEKREVYTRQDGSDGMGKAKGFNGVDFLLITQPEIAAKIRAALRVEPEKKDYAPGHGSAVEEEAPPKEQEELI